MGENYGSLEGTIDAYDNLDGEIDNHAEILGGEIQFGSGSSNGVDDVRVNGVSVVANKIADIDLRPYAEKEDVYDKNAIDTLLEGKADTGDIPIDLSDLQEDSDHRTVTDEEKTEWSGKADTSDIPTALSQLENDDNYVQDADYVHTDNNFTDEDKAAIGNIPENITDLSDVAVDNIQNGQVLKWDATQEKFVNADESGGSGDVTDVKVDGTSVVDPVTGEADIDLSGKADKALDAVAGDFAVLLANGNYANSGKSANDMASKAEMSVNTSGTQTTVQLKNGTSATINNPTITIQKNGQNVDSFTLNQDSNKAINIAVPTKTSDLQNDNSFITNTVNNLANYYLKTQTYTQAEVDALIDAAINGRFHKVNVLPATGEPNVIYLVPKATPETSNACDEYIWQDNAWELIGSTNIDLSGYVTDDELNTALADYLTTSAFNTAIANYYTKTEVGNLLDGKVDKVSGKGLSTYDYDATAKGIVDSVTTNLAGKVDKVNGKGLSTEDYTTTEKNKLAGISTGANKVESSTTNGNIKIDGTETQVYDGSGKVDKVNGKGLSTNDYDNTDKAKVDMIDNTTTSATGNPISISNLKSAQIALNPVITYNPIQDLHGQSKPYPAGGGKNKLNMADKTISGANWVFNKSACVLAAGTYIFSWNVNVSTQNSCELQVYDSAGNSIIADVTSNVQTPIQFTISQAAGYCRFYSATGGTFSKFMIRLSTESADYAPYENICPISGYDKVEVSSCGVNVWDEKWELGGLVWNTGAETTQTDRIRTGFIPVIGGATYYCYVISSITLAGFGAVYYNKLKERIDSNSGLNPNHDFTVPNDAVYMRCVFAGITTYSSGMSINYPATDTSYHAYHKTTDLSESLGQTVYGLTDDVRSGLCTDIWTKIDMSTLSWGYNGTQKRYEADLPNAKSVGSGRSDKIVCSKYATDIDAAAGDSWKVFQSGRTVFVYDNDRTGNPTGDVAYILADVTIQLTPHEIALSQGYAYLSTNGTSIALDYHNGEMARLGDVAQLNESVENKDVIKTFSVNNVSIRKSQKLTVARFNSVTANESTILQNLANYFPTDRVTCIVADYTSKKPCFVNIAKDTFKVYDIASWTALGSYNITGQAMWIE